MKRMASAGRRSRPSVASSGSREAAERRFAVCVRDVGDEASLARNELYVVLPDPTAERHGQVRVIDESGEDYLFSAGRFVAVEVPAAVRLCLLKAS